MQRRKNDRHSPSLPLGGSGMDDRWQSFVDSFGLVKSGVAPWDARVLGANYSGASHGERCTIAFLLNVWDANGDWPCGTFDVIDALSVWQGSPAHAAFVKWASSPWWP